MACHFADVYTQTFTPCEYQVEVLDSAKSMNTIVCCNTSSAKTFIAVKLLQEFSWEMRTKLCKRALFIVEEENVPVMTSHIALLTDLHVVSLTDIKLCIEDYMQHVKDSTVSFSSL